MIQETEKKTLIGIENENVVSIYHHMTQSLWSWTGHESRVRLFEHELRKVSLLDDEDVVQVRVFQKCGKCPYKTCGIRRLFFNSHH